jgi:hypothetical protein
MQQCIKIFISHLHEVQYILGDTPPIIRSLKLHWQPLVLHTWRIVGRVVAGRCQRPATTRPTTLHVYKTRGYQCSFRLLMMSGVSPETCWASCKYEIKSLIQCCILLDFLWELHYDARINEHQVYKTSLYQPSSLKHRCKISRQSYVHIKVLTCEEAGGWRHWQE